MPEFSYCEEILRFFFFFWFGLCAVDLEQIYYDERVFVCVRMGMRVVVVVATCVGAELPATIAAAAAASL